MSGEKLDVITLISATDCDQDFALKLQKHVIRRLRGIEDPAHEPTRADLDALRLRHNRLWLHKVLRVNYTSYDARRAQDSMNPRTHADIMMLASPEESHPYLYARILSVLHVNAYFVDKPDVEPQLIQVLWVRWFEYDHSAPGGFDTLRPHRLKFAHASEDPFDFLAPDKVLRGVHLSL